MRSKAVVAATLLASTIIGAGIFSLPYAVGKIGIGTGALYLAFFAALYGFVHLRYAEILNSEREPHEFSYFLERHFGRGFGRAAGYAFLLELVLVLTAYLILSPYFLEAIFGFSGLPALLAFWIFGSAFFFVKFKTLGIADAAGVAAIGAVVALVVWLGAGTHESIPSVRPFAALSFLLPFGPILFSLNGRPAIGKVVAAARRAESEGTPFSLRTVIFGGTIVPAALYFLFALGILRLNPGVSPEVLDSIPMVPSWVRAALGALGIVAVWTSYFMIGANVRDTLREDKGFSALGSGLAVVFLPLALYLAGVDRFLEAVSFIGGTLLAFEGVAIIFLWKRVFPNRRISPFSYACLAAFAGAFAYELVKWFV